MTSVSWSQEGWHKIGASRDTDPLLQDLSEWLHPQLPHPQAPRDIGQKRTNVAMARQRPHLRLLKGLLSRLVLRTQDSLKVREAQSLGGSGSGSHESKCF